jgi:thiamine biosynthesis lipoprotein
MTVRAERHDRAMGSDVHVVVRAPGPAAARLADLAVMRIELLEQCWSRFRSDSELSRLNAHAGRGPVAVSGDLQALVETMVAAWQWTEGAVDATVLGSMVALGYDADFTLVVTSVPQSQRAQPGHPIELRDKSAAGGRFRPQVRLTPGMGMGDVGLEPGHVTLPAGVGLDPGAIGKGLAGDIVTQELIDAGAHAVLVSIGGDVVTRGDHTWRVSLRDDRTPERDEIDVIELAGAHGAVATSSVLRRRWADRHHVIDPLTGQPVQSDVLQATVVADCGWRAEAGATVAVVRGSASETWLASRGCTAYLLGGLHA